MQQHQPVRPIQPFQPLPIRAWPFPDPPSIRAMPSGPASAMDVAYKLSPPRGTSFTAQIGDTGCSPSFVDVWAKKGVLTVFTYSATDPCVVAGSHVSIHALDAMPGQTLDLIMVEPRPYFKWLVLTGKRETCRPVEALWKLLETKQTGFYLANVAGRYELVHESNIIHQRMTLHETTEGTLLPPPFFELAVYVEAGSKFALSRIQRVWLNPLRRVEPTVLVSLDRTCTQVLEFWAKDLWLIQIPAAILPDTDGVGKFVTSE